MAFDTLGAIQAGYSPAEILNHVQKDGHFDVAGAKAAGYSDDEIIRHMGGNDVSTAKPVEAPHDLGSALVAGGNSTMAQLEQAGGALANTVGLPETGKNLIDRARANQATAAATYQPSPDIAGNLADTYDKGGVRSVAKKIGYGLAGAALPTAAAIGSGLAKAVPAVQLGLLGINAALNLGGALQEKERQGLDGTRVSGADALNTAAQTAIQALPFAKGGFGTMGMLDSGLRGAAQAGGNILSGTLQGGDPGSARDVASSIAEAGLQGAVAKPMMEFPTHAVAASARSVSDFVTTRKAGPNIRAYAEESKSWNDAVETAADRLRQANPNMAPEEVQSRAYQLAQKAGESPPTYETMSPQAQNGMAELATLQMYNAARQSMTEGIGRPNADIAPAAVFKNILQRATATMTELGNLLRRNEMIDGDQAGDFKAAIAEAYKHNVQAGENGAQFGYFDTLRDKVSALEIDPTIKNQALQMLRVMDIASQASLLKNSKGPLERNAGLILGAGGVGVGALVTGGAPLGLLGGLGASLYKAQGTKTLRGLDQVMGHGLPDVLQRQTAIEKFAQQNNLSAVADPVALQQMNAELRGLAPQSSARPAGPPPGYQPPTLAPKIPDQSMPQARSPIGPDPIPAPRPPGLSAYPEDRYQTVLPARAPQAPPEAPPKVPGMPIAPGAAETLNASLRARADRITRAAQEAFPTNRTGWSAAIADTAGADHGAVREYIDQRIASGELPSDLVSVLQQSGPISRGIMEHLTGHIRDLVDAGQIPRAGSARPDGPQEGTIRNPQAYARTLAQEAETAQSIRSQHPELADVVNQMQDPSANGKTQAGRHAILDEHLAGIGHEPTRAAQEAILRPLAGYGVGDTGGPQRGSSGPEKGPSGGGGPSAPSKGQQGVPGFGVDPTQRGSGRGGSPPEIRADQRFKTASPAPDQGPVKPATPLAGLPKAALGPDPRARTVAENYAQSTGRPYEPPTTYAKVDPARGARIADAYEAMQDAPQDPKVKGAYEAMAKETLSQYEAMLKSGFRISDLHTAENDPYPMPRDAIRDMRDNNRMSVFATDAGYGSSGITDKMRADNPLLADSGFKTESGKPLLVNDVFRAVHDYFGHGKEGVGFRADGEENAWRSHAAMYSDEARQAMTSETRGQNSWVNYGPNGAANRTASTADTVFADQKIGLMPKWTSEEGAGDNPLAASKASSDQQSADAQAKAQAALPGAQPTKGESAFLLHGPLDKLADGYKPDKATRPATMVDLAERDLVPARAASGVPVIKGYGDEAVSKTSALLTKEALYHLAGSDNALGWYDHKLKTAMAMMGKQFPELSTDSSASSLFKGILALTSNGNKVDDNFKDAAREYGKVRNAVANGDYRMPTDMTGHPRARVWNASAETWNMGVDKMGIEGLLDFLGTKAPISELMAKWKEATGETWKPSGEKPTAVLYGATILGPKIGNGFFSGLEGRFDMPTQDLWLSRTMGRLGGDMIKRASPENLQKNLDKVRDTLDALGPSDKLDINANMQRAATGGDAEALQAATTAGRMAVDRAYRNAKTQGTPEWSPQEDAFRRAVGAYTTASAGSLTDAPKSPGQREFNRKVILQTAETLKTQHDINISPADLQALIWTPEQRYWQRYHGMGSAKTDSDYQSAATKMLINNGGEQHARDVLQEAGHSPVEIANIISSLSKGNKQ